MLTRASWLLAMVAILCLNTCLPRSSRAYTPDSPEVQEMLSRAMAYLENAPEGPESRQLGGQCLLGLVAYKYNKRFGQQPGVLPPLTEKALAAALEKAENLRGENNYSIGISLIFLCEVHPQRHMSEIAAYVEQALHKQQPQGSWGYSPKGPGDLSQLQYGVLGLWSARNAGVEVPSKAMANVVEYVIRVQDPTGAWGYQGIDPGGYARVAQSLIRPSVCVAGLGSLYVGADFLGMSKAGEPRTVSSKRLPPALIPVVERDDRRPRDRSDASIDAGHLKQAMDDGQQWFRKQSSLLTDRYQYYFIYGLERYQSFKEKVEGTYEEEPQWYNDGVRLLRELQSGKGWWGDNSSSTPSVGCHPPIATSFAMLFLLRSTRDTIAEATDRDGVLRGGYGLPGDLTEIRVRNHQIVAPAITGEVEDLITMLEDEEGEKIENMLENPDVLSLSGMTGTGREFTARLARILRTGQSYKARIVAARTLGRQGELDNVPILIFALTDPDPQVVQEARDGLRLVSRKFDGFGLPKKPNPSEIRTVAKAWKGWYKSVRPDAVFMK